MPWNWSGFYFGAHAGYRWVDVDANAAAAGFPSVIPGFPGTAVFPLLPASATFHPNSGAFGLLTGQNFVLSNPFLVGWEADVTWGRGRASTAAFSMSNPTLGAVGSGFFSTNVDWAASLRARVGYVTGPWLVYGTFGASLQRVTISGFGGFAGANTVCTRSFDSFGCDGFGSLSTNSSFGFSLTKTLVGAVVGTGIERLISNNLTLRIEYLAAIYGRVDFGNVVINSSYSDNFSCNCTVNSTLIGNVSANVTTQTLRIGLAAKIP